MCGREFGGREAIPWVGKLTVENSMKKAGSESCSPATVNTIFVIGGFKLSVRCVRYSLSTCKRHLDNNEKRSLHLRHIYGRRRPYLRYVWSTNMLSESNGSGLINRICECSVPSSKWLSMDMTVESFLTNACL